MKLSRSWISVALVAAVAISAKTPQQLKDQFKAVLPAGMKARAAWPYKKTIHVVDSDDGVVRDLLAAAPAVSPDFGGPAITHDGSKVYFEDAPSNKIYMINWDGSGGYKTILTGSGDISLSDNYYDKDGDWAVIIANTYDAGPIINVETLVKKNAWTAGGIDASNGWGYDGTYIFSTWNEIFKMALAPNGAPTTVNTGGNVCVGTLSQDGSHTAMVQFDAHLQVIQCPNGTNCTKYDHTADILKKVPAGCTSPSGDPADGTRWTSSGQFITCVMQELSENPVMVNPKVNTQWVTMETACGADVGRLYVLIYSSSTSISQPAPKSAVAGRAELARADVGGYSLTGRRIDCASTNKTVCGIVIRLAKGVAGTAELRPVPSM